MDDLDTDVLGHYLKIWADKWECSGEIKGASIPLKHTRFIVTSNKPIIGLFVKDNDLAMAIQRRFKETWIQNIEDVYEWDF